MTVGGSVPARGGMGGGGGGGNKKKKAGLAGLKKKNIEENGAQKKGLLYLDVVLALPAAEAEAGIFKNHAQETADKAEALVAVAPGSFRRRPRKQRYPRRAPFF